MIQLKAGVKLASLTPQILLAVQAAEHIWWNAGQTTLVITSANDSQHKNGSFHFQGRAVDFRIQTMPRKLRDQATRQLREALGSQFDVLHEDPDGPNAHIHVEWEDR